MKKILGIMVMAFWFILMGVILIDEDNYQYAKEHVEQKYMVDIESRGYEILSVEFDNSRLWETDYEIKYMSLEDDTIYGSAGTIVAYVW